MEVSNCHSVHNKFSMVSFGKGNRSLLMPKNKNIAYYTGCLLGGAIGDAFGAPVEFMKLKKIKKIYGENGLQDLVLINNKANFTDDTQLTLFTADGLIKSFSRKFSPKVQPKFKIIYKAYEDWYKICAENTKIYKGFISKIKQLYGTGGSGKTCMSTLQEGIPGSLKKPINNSKGSGGVMRVAPVGMIYHKAPQTSFKIAMQCAALTHGSSSACLSAGVYSAIISELLNGKNVEQAVNSAMNILKQYPDSKELYQMIDTARKLSKSKLPDSSLIQTIGKGWNGDEAIAMSVFSAMRYPNDYKKAIICAVNHDGDSDTVGSIVGGIMGAHLGIENIPQKYVKNLLMQNKIKQISKDLFLLSENKINTGMNKRYPKGEIYD